MTGGAEAYKVSCRRKCDRGRCPITWGIEVPEWYSLLGLLYSTVEGSQSQCVLSLLPLHIQSSVEMRSRRILLLKLI